MRRTLIAVNTAPESENRMHGDEAADYGFESGLVPGVDVLGYLAHAGVERWGAAWLGGGRLDGRLVKPVYDREEVVVEAVEGGGELGVTVAGTDGGARATAQLSLLEGEQRSSFASTIRDLDIAIAIPPDPDDRPPAEARLLEPDTILATQWATFHADRAQTYLDEISEDHPAFRVDGLAHPGWLLRFANWALSSTVRLGPWIHVSSDAWFLSPVRDGETLEVRAHVTDRFERKGHELVELAVRYHLDEVVVAFVEHTAIWKPRRA